MVEASIRVDLFNPGQVFACLGFLEAAEILVGDAEGGFDWSDETDVRFILRSRGNRNPFEVTLEFLDSAGVVALVPPGSNNSTTKWKVPTEGLAADAPFPFPDPGSPATLPAVLATSDGTRRIVLDHWGDETVRDNVKFWAGAGGYPGAALARDALELVRGCCLSAVADPFSLSAPQESSFRLDWRRDYIPMDIGFSLNEHKSRMTTVGFPIVELLAALGLGNARPLRLEKTRYRYGVIGVRRHSNQAHHLMLYDPAFLRAALGCAALPFPARCFEMTLGWPGQEGQARVITEVWEVRSDQSRNSRKKRRDL